MSDTTNKTGTAGTKPDSADAGSGNTAATQPSQVDVLEENETLKGQVSDLTTRATTAEGQAALLTSQRDSASAQVTALTKQVGELTTQLKASNDELATLRPKAADATKQAAAQVAAAGIVGGASKPNEASGSAAKKSLTEQAIANRKAAGLAVPK